MHSEDIDNLLGEMADIFGEDRWLDEAHRQPKKQPSKRGLVKGKGGGTASAGTKKQLSAADKRAVDMWNRAKKAHKEASKDKKAADRKGDKGIASIRREADKGEKKSKAHARMKAHQAKRSAAGAQTARSSGKSSKEHSPFKRSSEIGHGPRNGKNHKSGCWNCSCGNIYQDGCECKSTGRGEKCPPAGTMKHIQYHPDAHRAYNNEYHSTSKTSAAREKGELARARRQG